MAEQAQATEVTQPLPTEKGDTYVDTKMEDEEDKSEGKTEKKFQKGWWWWWVDVGSGNGLVPSGNKPLPGAMLTRIIHK